MCKIKTEEDKILKLLSDPDIRNSHLMGIGEVQILESKLADYYQKEYVIPFPNATSAIWALIIALNIKRERILTSPFGWGGALAPFLFSNNIITFIETDECCNILPSAVFKEDSKRLLVFSQDFGGFPTQTERLKEILNKKNGLLISDASQSFGAFYSGKPAGYFADIIILSFTSQKKVTCFEGGAIITDRKDIYESITRYSQHPYRQKIHLGLQNYNEFAPINGRIHPLAAWILNKTFEYQLENLKTEQNKYYKMYLQLVEESIIKPIPQLEMTSNSTFFEFLVRLNPKSQSSSRKLNSQFKDFSFSDKTLIPFFLRKDFMRSFGKKIRIHSYNAKAQKLIKVKLNN